MTVNGPSSRFDAVYRLGNNLSGQYKRAVGMALQIGIGNFGGAVASNVYRSQDEPRYLVGREYRSNYPKRAFL